jgi:hypothetical protein
MTIRAYTEPHNDYPAYVNLGESKDGLFTLTVRSQGNGGRDTGTIRLTREDLLNLVNDACVHLDGDVSGQADDRQHEAKQMTITADRTVESSGMRAHALEMALRTPNITGYGGVLAAATAYQAHITGQPAAGPDVGLMVNRFLGWKLPQDFAPDAGISFTPVSWPLGWPVGTNLLSANQARAMFEHVLGHRAV